MKKLISIQILLSLALWGCTSDKPELIVYGKDSCSFCKMHISDKRYGAEIVTAKGKVFKFDTIECMLEAQKSNADKIGTSFKEYIVDTTKDGELVPAEQALFFEDKKLRSPMGRAYVVALDKEELTRLAKLAGAREIFDWKQLKERIQ